MKARRVEDIRNYVSPSSPNWSQIPSTHIEMMPTPLQMQPTEYIRRSWENKPYGQSGKLDVASVHDGETWALRGTWQGSGPGATDFPDALAIALPVRNNPALALMGAKDAPIHYLRWSADKKEVLSLLATGIGFSQPGPQLKCSAQAVVDGTVWQLVITRALRTGKDIAPLAAGKKTGIGFALWRGSNDERAGIKAFSIDWVELELDA